MCCYGANSKNCEEYRFSNIKPVYEKMLEMVE